MSRGFRRFIWKKLTLEFKGLTWKLAFGFRGFIGKKKFLGSKGWLAAILDYGGHWLAAIDWRPFWIVAAIFYSHSWTLNVFHRRSHWTCSPYTTSVILIRINLLNWSFNHNIEKFFWKSSDYQPCLGILHSKHKWWNSCNETIYSPRIAQNVDIPSTGTNL